MGIFDHSKSGASRVWAAVQRALGKFAAIFTFPVAILVALIGQFALGSLVMAVSPPVEPGASVKLDGALWAQAIMLVAQGAALIVAISRKRLRASRVYLALVAFVWAIASMLLIYVAFECDLGGMCL